LLLLSTERGVSSFSPLIHFTEQPELEWKVNVLGQPGRISTPGLIKHNAIITSKDGSLLYMTMDDGSLVVVDTLNGTTRSIYRPPSLGEGFFTSNDYSGVALSHDRADNLLYAVHDSPPQPAWNGTFWYDLDPWYAEDRYEDSARISPSFPNDVYINPTTLPDTERSRVISLDSKGNLRWMHEVEGNVVGTPLFGSHLSTELVYVLHNVDNIGRLSILQVEPFMLDLNTTINTNATLTTLYNVTTFYHEVSTYLWPYAPMTMVTDKGANASNNDVLYWSETRDDLPGYDRRGKFHRATITPAMAVNTKDDRNEYIGTPTHPVVSHNHSEIYIMGRRSTVALMNFDPNPSGMGGWWSGTIQLPKWAVHLDISERNETMPLGVAGVLTKDDSRMFVPGGGTSLFSLNVTDGTDLWEYDSKQSTYVAQLKLSPDDEVVYSISARSGLVMAQDATSGNIYWQMDCTTFESSHKDCQDSVEAEFTLSPDGTRLYYGDIFGSVTAIKVAELDLIFVPMQTSAPSSIPSVVPTQVKSNQPSALPSLIPSNAPNTMPSIQPSTGPSIMPSDKPSMQPSFSPSSQPSVTPSDVPSFKPSSTPSDLPSTLPSNNPSGLPSAAPSRSPSGLPSEVPSRSPSGLPSAAPSRSPSDLPSQIPSVAPSDVPSAVPSVSLVPSLRPIESEAPSALPTSKPSANPSSKPASAPSTGPTLLPTKSSAPSDAPSVQPTDAPSVSTAPTTSSAPSTEQQVRSSIAEANALSPAVQTTLLSVGAVAAACVAAVAVALGYKAYQGGAGAAGAEHNMEDADGFDL
jgi:hypothetical protein